MQNQLRSELTTLLQSQVNIRNPSYPDAYGGLSPQTFVVVSASPNVNILSDEIENAEAKGASIGFSQELRPNLAVHVDGIFTDVDKMIQPANINTPDAVTSRRPIAGWGNVTELGSRGFHDYRALYVRVDKRLADRHQYMVSYTLAKERNSGSTGVATAVVTDFYNPSLDYGPGNGDRRHGLVASGSVVLPFEISLGGIWTLRSAVPLSARAGRDLNADGVANTDYVPGNTRKKGRQGNDSFMQAVKT